MLDRLRALLSSRTDVSETLAPLDLDAYAHDGALRKVLKLSERWLAMPPVELKSLVPEIVDRITVAADRGWHSSTGELSPTGSSLNTVSELSKASLDRAKLCGH